MRFFSNKSKIADRLSEFSNNFSEIVDHARTLYASSDSLRRVVSEENDAVVKSSSALEEINSMLSRTSEGASQLADKAAEARDSVASGKSAIDDVIKRLSTINESSDQLGQTIESSIADLERVTSALSEIKAKANVINDIVFQTKLLSFNASVEAARAGEHGKGFAVVADEMAKLAISSGSAATAINGILQTNLESTHQIVSQMKERLLSLMNRSRKDVEEGSSAGEKGAVAFDAILSQVSAVTELSAQISDATKEQAIGVQEITSSVRQLENTSSQLSQVADQTLKSSLALSEKSESQSKSLSLLGEALGTTIVFKPKTFDFDAAISAHLDWKMKLSRYQSNPDGSLSPEKVGVDNACPLGKWIYSDGSAYQSMDTYLALRKAHAQFHTTAATVIRHLNENGQSAAKKMLDPSGEYMSVSERCVGLIRQLKAEVHDQDQSHSEAA